MVEEPNHEWIMEVQKRYPGKHTAMLVAAGSSNPRQAAEAVAALRSAGYTDVVEIRCVYAALLSCTAPIVCQRIALFLIRSP